MCTALARWERVTKLSTFPEIGKRVGQLRQVLFSVSFPFLLTNQVLLWTQPFPLRGGPGGDVYRLHSEDEGLVQGGR